MGSDSPWPRREHGELHKLSDNLWLVEGPVPGMLYRRQMVVARDEHGQLLLHSVIALDCAGMSALEALGAPTWLVVPNGYHRLDAPAYAQRYPQLRVVTPRGSVERVQAVVGVSMTYDEFPGGSTLQLEPAPWPNAPEGILRVRSPDGVTLVFNDLLWTPPEAGWSAPLYRLLRQKPQVPFVARRMFASDRAPLKTWLETLAQTQGLVRVIPGHGPPITRDAPAALSRVAAAL